MAIESFPTHAIDLVSILGDKFPPRCMAQAEKLEDHLRYAGKVELIAYLNEWLEAANRVSKE